jgi:hypothetical protein
VSDAVTDRIPRKVKILIGITDFDICLVFFLWKLGHLLLKLMLLLSVINGLKRNICNLHYIELFACLVIFLIIERVIHFVPLTFLLLHLLVCLGAMVFISKLKRSVITNRGQMLEGNTQPIYRDPYKQLVEFIRLGYSSMLDDKLLVIK